MFKTQSVFVDPVIKENLNKISRLAENRLLHFPWSKIFFPLPKIFCFLHSSVSSLTSSPELDKAITIQATWRGREGGGGVNKPPKRRSQPWLKLEPRQPRNLREMPHNRVTWPHDCDTAKCPISANCSKINESTANWDLLTTWWPSWFRVANRFYWFSNS